MRKAPTKKKKEKKKKHRVSARIVDLGHLSFACCCVVSREQIMHALIEPVSVGSLEDLDIEILLLLHQEKKKGTNRSRKKKKTNGKKKKKHTLSRR